MTLTEIRTHWHGMGITEFIEDGATVFVPLWANGCADERSVAGTPRFATLGAATVAVDSMFRFRALMSAHRANQRADLSVTAPVAAVAVVPAYDETTCWECGCKIEAGEGTLDEPMGYAHRSCIGA
jgi:hypothetical protein